MSKDSENKGNLVVEDLTELEGAPTERTPVLNDVPERYKAIVFELADGSHHALTEVRLIYRDLGEVGLDILIGLKVMILENDDRLRSIALVRYMLNELKKTAQGRYQLDLMPLLKKLVLSYGHWSELLFMEFLIKNLYLAMQRADEVGLKRFILTIDWESFEVFMLFWANVEKMRRFADGEGGLNYVRIMLEAYERSAPLKKLDIN